MKRRNFITLLSSAMASLPLAAHAQRTTKIARIGFLTTGSLDHAATHVALNAFHQGLREFGYVDGQNILIVIRAAGSRIERFPALANELVELKVDVIVASNSPAGRAAQQATTTIPIVIPIMGDPVGEGLVASLSRPGGNITGFTFLGPQLVPKRLALLKEALPVASRVAALWHPRAYGERTMNDMVDEAETGARALGLKLRYVPVQGPGEFDEAFSTISAEGADAVIVFPSPMLFTERRSIVDLAVKHRLALITMGKEFVEIGALLSYGADINDFIRRSASYVDKILKGAKPGDLPVEQPTKFELFINLKTAKQLGLELPATLIARADEVIE